LYQKSFENKAIENFAGALLAAASVTTPTPMEDVGCLQSPCPSGNAVCGSTNNDTIIECVCQEGDPVSSGE